MEDQHASPPPQSAPAAAVRARHPQMLLRFAEERVPAGEASIASALSEGTRIALAAADPMAWLPVAIDVEMVEAVAARLGPEAWVDVLEVRQREELKSAVLDSFIQATLRVFTPSPANLVKRIPAGWGRLFRNAGWITVLSVGQKVAVTRFHRLPAVCIGSAEWMASLPVSLRTFYDLVAATGTVECRVEDAAQGIALVTFRWK